MIDENVLHGMGRRIGNAGGGITIQIEKKAEMAGELKVYIYFIMDALLNIPDGTFYSTKHQENCGVIHAGTPYDAVCGSEWGRKEAPTTL